MDAQRHFYDRKAGSARYHAALQSLMGAYEYLKTILGDGTRKGKPKAIKGLVDVLSGGDATIHDHVDAYLRAVTDFSNDAVRHTERGNSDLDDELSEFLFYSTYTFIRTALRRLQAKGLVKLDDAADEQAES